MFSLKSYSLCTFVTCGALITPSAHAKVLDSVETNLAKARTCLEAERYQEAQAYAELTLLPRIVTYSANNDLLGIAKASLMTWEDALGGQVSFVECPWYDASLKFDFRPKLSFYGRDVLGLATTRRSVQNWGGDFRTVLTGSIEVSTFLPNGDSASYVVMLSTAVHEVGHFLGLDDTSHRGSLMGPISTQKPTLAPQASELAALTSVRQQAGMVALFAELQGTGLISQ